MILSTAFMNSGNLRAPIILFAYGETAFAYAIYLMVLHAIMMNFCGIYYAAMGGRVMVILGMQQLAVINLSKLEWEKISFEVVSRLLNSPAIAVGIVFLIPMDPFWQKSWF